MVTELEQKRLRHLITETVTVLCQSSLNFRSKFTVEGLLGITVDDTDVFLINIHEVISSQQGLRCDVVKETSANTTDDDENDALLERHAMVACAQSPTSSVKKSSSKQTYCLVPHSAPQNMYPSVRLDEQIGQLFTHESIQSQTRIPLPAIDERRETMRETSLSISSTTGADQLISDTSSEVHKSQDHINTVKEETLSETDALDSQLDCADPDFSMEIWSESRDTHIQV